MLRDIISYKKRQNFEFTGTDNLKHNPMFSTQILDLRLSCDIVVIQRFVQGTDEFVARNLIRLTGTTSQYYLVNFLLWVKIQTGLNSIFIYLHLCMIKIINFFLLFFIFISTHFLQVSLSCWITSYFTLWIGWYYMIYFIRQYG